MKQNKKSKWPKRIAIMGGISMYVALHGLMLGFLTNQTAKGINPNQFLGITGTISLLLVAALVVWIKTVNKLYKQN